MDQPSPGRSGDKIVVIVGPTASGKSALAWELARQYNGEVISADSRQVYRGLDIGTGKEKFPQHLIDIANLDEDYNVSHFVRDARRVIKDIAVRDKLPIIVGGTGLWINALIYGYQIPEVKPRYDFRAELEKKTWQELFEQLEKLDPHRAKHIDRHNKRRLVRALEIVMASGRSVGEIKKVARYDALWLGIKLSQEELKKRIEVRIDRWIAEGLYEEAKKLSNPEKFGFMYAGLARDQMVRATMQYAKRQMTWFKRNREINWITSAREAHALLQDWLSPSSYP